LIVEVGRRAVAALAAGARTRGETQRQSRPIGKPPANATQPVTHLVLQQAPHEG
jgi:hypothetical protein